jgi:two-component system CheB/CheR fusion protein
VVNHEEEPSEVPTRVAASPQPTAKAGADGHDGAGPTEPTAPEQPRRRKRPSAKGESKEGVKDQQSQLKDAEFPDGRFSIVAIGASAGGLEPLSNLLKRITLESMGVIIVQHLPPHHDSVLPALLVRASGQNIVAAQDGMEVERNHVYVIPPNSDLAILRGVLHLMSPPSTESGAPPRPRHPIDYFMRSLAEDQGPRAIGVVLSGTGTDGTFGLRAIKEAGGITFAQSPESSRYDGMPRSAIDSGWADISLDPDGIADELVRITRSPYLVHSQFSSPPLQESVAKLIVLMRAAFGNDLSAFKSTTVERRIARRMALHRIEKITDYLKFVQTNPEEIRVLYKDMLIGVTAFFRDKDSLDALKNKIFPRILEGKEPGAPIRVWVPACATGEEAYSIAISLLEFLGDRAQDYRLQIFGTDVDEGSITFARRGCYPANIAIDVSSDRLQRYFVKKDREFQVCRRIRDMVVFSSQNVTKDAPFSRLDLVSCRNLLIYLRAQIQKKVLRILHYSLLPAGYLMLGTSESVGESGDLFSLVDRKNKIYSKKSGAPSAGLDIGFGVRHADAMPTIDPSVNHRTTTSLSSLAERKILELYAPPGVVVNDELDVIHIRGRTGAYLEPMPGAPSFNILRLARPSLHVDLRRAIKEAQTTNGRSSVTCRLNEAGNVRVIQIEVIPLLEPESKTRCLLILFHEDSRNTAETITTESKTPPADSADGERLRELERDLVVTKEYLQSAIEELESTNEELKSSNEELQSSNEELQSTNEELETSKEELQSSNEELTTVNDELQNRMSELQQTNDDLHNILGGIGNAVVIVGLDLRIRRFTHAAETLLNLVPGDVGRSISQLNAFIIGKRIEEVAARVIEHLVAAKEEILCADHRWYELNVTPYKTLDHSINGAVIVLVDIDAAKRTAEKETSKTERH